jgi:quercetin dioxygenase-like cupin family protein
MSHYVTTHDSDGKAVFSTKAPSEHLNLPIPIGEIQIISTTHSFPPNLSTEDDIDRYQVEYTRPLFPGTRRNCPDDGTVACMITMKPGVVSGMHRSITMDVVVVIEGVVEVHLDSGETRTLQPGDTLVQRATMHKWANVTPNGGVAKWFACIQAAAEPLEIGGKVLASEWAAAH